MLLPQYRGMFLDAFPKLSPPMLVCLVLILSLSLNILFRSYYYAPHTARLHFHLCRIATAVLQFCLYPRM